MQENGAKASITVTATSCWCRGADVRGGGYYETWPGLANGKLVSGDVTATTGYRSVRAEIVGNRFPDASLPELFPGFTPRPLGPSERVIAALRGMPVRRSLG